MKYLVTTPDPGASTDLLNGYILSPLSTAALANNPAAIKESGLLVFVHDVIADTTIDPFLNSQSYPSNLNLCTFPIFSFFYPNPLNPTLAGKISLNSFF